MALQIHRHRADDAAAGILECQVLRRPASARGCRTALFEGVKKDVRYRRVDVAGAGIPSVGQHLLDRAMDAQLNRFRFVGHQAISTAASTSTATPAGSELTPTAARACRPASPK